MIIHFSTEHYQFGFDPEVGLRDFPCDVEHYLDEDLSSSPELPSEIGNAPIASWVLARLRKIAPFEIPEEYEEGVDGGGYVFDYVVFQKESPVSCIQLQGDMEGVALLGTAKNEDLAQAVARDLIQLLLAEPNGIEKCCFEIYDPEWQYDPSWFIPTPSEESRNEYGWDGVTYLGRFNIRERRPNA